MLVKMSVGFRDANASPLGWRQRQYDVGFRNLRSGRAKSRERKRPLGFSIAKAFGRSVSRRAMAALLMASALSRSRGEVVFATLYSGQGIDSQTKSSSPGANRHSGLNLRTSAQIDGAHDHRYRVYRRRLS